MTQEDLFQMGLLEAVQTLHMNLTGASDTCMYGHYTMKDIYLALVQKIKEWKPSGPDVELYDTVVKALIQTVIFDYQRYVKKI